MSLVNCRSRRTGKLLKHYGSKGEALRAAETTLRMNNLKLYPYLCEKCGLWHLSPNDVYTPGEPCPACTDSSGGSKIAYLRESYAQKRADEIYRESGQNLRVYECPYGYGWHLIHK